MKGMEEPTLHLVEAVKELLALTDRAVMQKDIKDMLPMMARIRKVIEHMLLQKERTLKEKKHRPLLQILILKDIRL